MLPWYMAWYEDWVVADLSTNQPRLVIYDPDSNVWGFEHYAPRVTKYLEQNYTRDATHKLAWIKNQ